MGGGVSTAVKQTVEENQATDLTPKNSNSTNSNHSSSVSPTNSSNKLPAKNNAANANRKAPDIETVLTTPREPLQVNSSPAKKFETGLRNSHQGGPPLTLHNLSPTHNPFKSRYQLKRDDPTKFRQSLEEEGSYMEVVEGKTTFESEFQEQEVEGKTSNDAGENLDEAGSKVDEKVDDTMMLKSMSTFINSDSHTKNPETLGLVGQSGMVNMPLQPAKGDISNNQGNPNYNVRSQFNKPVVHKRKKKKPKTTNSLFPIDSESKKVNDEGVDQAPEPVPQYITLDLPKDDLPHPSLPLGPPTDEVRESFESKRFLSGIDGLKQRWGEVQFLLRIPIEVDNDNFDLVHQTSHQSILFLQEMKTMAKEYGVLQGALSQWLMPFDSNTSASDQTSIRRLRKGEHGSRLDEVPDEKRIEMIKKLIDLRKLVKVKIADDNDLDLARRTVIDIDAFCRLLVMESERRNSKGGGGNTPFDILTKELTL